MPPAGLDRLEHLVVVMMGGRSFDHMLGSLKAVNAAIDGLTGGEWNPDPAGDAVPVQPNAKYQGQLEPEPRRDFAAVHEHIFDGGSVPGMKGFVRSYFKERRDIEHSHRVMYYFTKDQLPVLTTLAIEFAVFNRWFAAVPGPWPCNRAFAHYGTSFGRVGTETQYIGVRFKSIYERVRAGGGTAKLYYVDRASSTMELANVLLDQPQIFGTHEQFLADCRAGSLPQYAFVEPNYADHDGLLASDQRPDHHVAEGERFIASIYMAIRSNPVLWPATALLITYEEHGGLFDHVPPPACSPDDFVAPVEKTGTGRPFSFDRLGVRVPAVLVSPWVPRGTVVDQVFEHASIPATVTRWLLPAFPDHDRSSREIAAATFLDLLWSPVMRSDAPDFQ